MQLENIEYPIHVWNMKEMQAISGIIDEEASKIAALLDEQDANLMVSTSNEEGLSRREKILGITPLDTDTLEERRYKVLINWYDTYPYTQKDLETRLARICTDGKYSLEVNIEEQKVTCLLAVANTKNFVAVEKLLEDLVPLQIVIVVGNLYNKWKKYSNVTWSSLATTTWKSMREDI